MDIQFNLYQTFYLFLPSQLGCRHTKAHLVCHQQEAQLEPPKQSGGSERGFSQLKILKSDIHSTLSEERLNDLLAVKLLSADIQNFDPMPAIELWNT